MSDIADRVPKGEIINDGSDGEEIVISDPQTVSRRTSSRERVRRATALKLAGASYEQIAENLGYASADSARKAVNNAIKKSLQENANELRRIHYGRLEHMLMLVWPQVNQGDNTAFHSALAVMDRMERLYGLNAAEKIEVTTGPHETVMVADGSKDAYIAAMREAIEAEDVVEAEVVEEAPLDEPEPHTRPIPVRVHDDD